MRIKAVLLCGVFFLTLSSSVFSQNRFTGGTNLISAGTGFGNVWYRRVGSGGYDFKSSPAFVLIVDHALLKWDPLKKYKVVIGTFGLGGILGYENSSLNYTYVYGFWKYNFNNFVAAARGTFHYGFIPSQRFDLYGGLMLGVRVETYHYTTNYGANDLGNYGGLHPIAGVFIGGTFYIVDPLALFAEYGYDVCFLKVGITIKP